MLKRRREADTQAERDRQTDRERQTDIERQTDRERQRRVRFYLCMQVLQIKWL
jgi:hypothetical protein